MARSDLQLPIVPLFGNKKAVFIVGTKFQNTYIYNWISRWSLCLLNFDRFLQLLAGSALLTHHQLSKRNELVR